MSNSQSSSRFDFTRSLFALVEFGFGVLIALVGAFGLFPSVELNVAILIGIFVMLSLVLYIARLMIRETLIEMPRKTKGIDGVLSVLLSVPPLSLQSIE
jgi:hypothetical protein